VIDVQLINKSFLAHMEKLSGRDKKTYQLLKLSACCGRKKKREEKDGYWW
jgi:hypothetical protein